MNQRTLLASVALATAVVTGGVVATVAAVQPTGTVQALAAVATFPTPATTGVPASTALTPYTGPLTISSCGVVIDGKTINGDLNITKGNGTHSAATPCVTIRNSRINGIIDDGWTSKYNAGPVVVTDTEVANPTPRDVACISDTNYYLTRVYAHGCRSGAQADGYWEIRDSYLLADTEFGTAHMDAFITNGNYGQPFVLDHNSFLCKPNGSVPNGSGCAADLGLFGDFSAITNGTITNNLFRATNDAYFCVHTGYEPSKPFPNGKNLTYTGNVWEKGSSGTCGGAGSAVFAWNNSAGTWCNNLFSDGTQALPGNTDNCGSVPPTTVTTTTVKAPTTLGTVVSTVPAPTTTKPPVTTTTKPTTSTTGPVTTTTACLRTLPRVCTVAG